MTPAGAAGHDAMAAEHRAAAAATALKRMEADVASGAEW